MAKKLCECNLNFASILLLIDVFASRILSTHNMQYIALLSRESFHLTKYCCQLQKLYLSSLHSLMSLIHERRIPRRTISTEVIMHSLNYIFTEGDKLIGQITVLHYDNAGTLESVLLNNCFIAEQFVVRFYRVDLDSFYLKRKKHASVTKVYFQMKKGGLKISFTEKKQALKGIIRLLPSHFHLCTL